jgi:hypothetical protein
MWTELSFGEYAGATLPQIVFNDADWFFWSISAGVWATKSARLKQEVDMINRRAQHIAIPNNADHSKQVEYYIHPSSGRIAGFGIVAKDEPFHEGSTGTIRADFLNLIYPRVYKPYDKLGCRLIKKGFKINILGNPKAVLTQKFCEEFFDNPDNFTVF